MGFILSISSKNRVPIEIKQHALPFLQPRTSTRNVLINVAAVRVLVRTGTAGYTTMSANVINFVFISCAIARLCNNVSA